MSRRLFVSAFVWCVVWTMCLPMHGCRRSFSKDRFGDVVRAYKADTLKATDGRIRLPREMASLTSDGFVYITHLDNGDDLFLFATWRGKGSNLRGYLYHDCSSGDVLLPHGSGSLAIVTPVIYPGRGPVEVRLEKMEDSHWYRAERSLD